jgi:hypothetical protein
MSEERWQIFPLTFGRVRIVWGDDDFWSHGY